MAVTEKQQEISQAFADAVLGAESPEGSSLVAKVNAAAREHLAEVALPAPKDEEWRFVRLRPLTNTEFVPADEIDASVNEAMVADYAVPEAEGKQLVFVNGRFSTELSDTSGFADEVFVGNLAALDDAPAEVEERLGQIAGYYADDYFLNLNAAGFTDGAVVVVPKDTKVEGVVHLLYISTESSKAYAAHPRNLVLVGQGSKMTMVEDYVGPHSSTYFNNVVNEIAVDASATLHHTKVQRDGQAAYHIGRTAIDLERGATYNSQTISLGAKFSRYDVYANGDAEEIDCTLDGLAVLSGEQVSDTHTVMDHRKAHAGSHQLHKMVLDDKSHAVFNGKIFVQPKAQIIDAYQLNRTLLLSDDAKVNAKPQLEIFADDVKCTHGATIGQLEEDQFFYLKSRGLNERDARNMLVYAFAAEVIETIPVDSVKKALEDAVSQRTSMK
ncbi:Fe-S cluster assembly protein SufD [Persicimonas caeni]|uniref:Fe-S cluster assembly protein SufD n=1 Tax=Persicimonas caeni TaxID=2292766 RepID=A0A4Y6Q3C5_PERCE|nr:Fe-S cluster assembly protein SufD [Persicimonas caeni]QDG54667.1 Fe-S cluster assembly protein SufD [Persicimonas caeni]QED35888.1 Fe-S cluster assembly protein SufD [Persicimonas caeni]